MTTQAEREERERIVAWLHAQGDAIDPNIFSEARAAYHRAAYALERGEHLEY